MGGSATLLGRTGRKIGLNVEKWSFSQGLSREFSRLSLKHQNTLFLTKFTPVKAQKVLKLYFLTNFKQFPHFLPSPYFGAKF